MAHRLAFLLKYPNWTLEKVMLRSLWVVVVSLALFVTAGSPGSVKAADPSGAELAPGMVNPGYHDKPDWFKNSFLDIREDVADAKAAGKRLVLYFYQDGCPYCKKLPRRPSETST